MKIKMREMAFDRQDIMREAKAQFPVILKHWVLIRWAAENDPGNQNLSHWQEELATAMWNVGSMRLTKGNTRETVRKAINEMYFTKMQVQNMDLSSLVRHVGRVEHAALDVPECEAAFKEALPKAVRVMATGDYDAILEYVTGLAEERT